MANILEIARLANVSAENVLRVVNGEPVSEQVASQVAKAIEVVGPPPSPRAAVEVLSAESAAERESKELVARFVRTAAELEASLPHDVGSVVYEALRLEVRPVAQHIAELGAVFERMIGRLDDIREEVESERRERVQDVALLSELIAAGWRSVDRRLARLEQMLSRPEEKDNGKRGAQHFRFSDDTERPAAD